jgi:hypothetical protein
MDRHQIARGFTERPVIFLVGMAIMAAFILGLLFFLYYALTNGHSNRENVRMGVNCTNWSYESPVEKHISGPDIQQACERYLAARSTDDAQRDDAIWQQKIDAANAIWESHRQ